MASLPGVVSFHRDHRVQFITNQGFWKGDTVSAGIEVISEIAYRQCLPTLAIIGHNLAPPRFNFPTISSPSTVI